MNPVAQGLAHICTLTAPIPREGLCSMSTQKRRMKSHSWPTGRFEKPHPSNTLFTSSRHSNTKLKKSSLVLCVEGEAVSTHGLVFGWSLYSTIVLYIFKWFVGHTLLDPYEVLLQSFLFLSHVIYLVVLSFLDLLDPIVKSGLCSFSSTSFCFPLFICIIPKLPGSVHIFKYLGEKHNRAKTTWMEYLYFLGKINIASASAYDGYQQSVTNVLSCLSYKSKLPTMEV